MDVEILKKDTEPLMHRTSFKAKVVFSGKTPSRTDMMKELCSKLSSKDKMTVIRKIDTDYGSERALLEGYYYDDETVMNKIENKHIKMRHLTKEEQKAEKEKVKAAKQAAATAAPAKGKK